ncbi:MAG: stage III sporulation protein AD, partial [Lachnospiraceae bacterium]|nr:stage III sporulation protein AD [Lachnospiraceae bacterium]
MTIIQAAAIGIVAMVLAVQIKALRPEYSTYLILTAGVIIAALGVSRLEVIMETIRAIGTYIHVQNIYIGTLLKMV